MAQIRLVCRHSKSLVPSSTVCLTLQDKDKTTTVGAGVSVETHPSVD
jgi:hypothetical protein